MFGYRIQGYKAYPICEEDTSLFRIRGKTCYMGHRRYLCPDHKWCNNKEYDCIIERRFPPIMLSGDDILPKFEKVWKCRPSKNDKVVKEEKQRMNYVGYKHEINWKHKRI